LPARLRQKIPSGFSEEERLHLRKFLLTAKFLHVLSCISLLPFRAANATLTAGFLQKKFFASAATRANPARKLYVQNLCPRTPPLRPACAPNVLRHKGAHFMVVRGKKQKAEVPSRQ